jgi:hypothetical protein
MPDMMLANVGGPFDEKRLRFWKLSHGYSLLMMLNSEDFSDLLFLRSGEPFLWITSWVEAQEAEVSELVEKFAQGLKEMLSDGGANDADTQMAELKVNAAEWFAKMHGESYELTDYGAGALLQSIMRRREG